MPFFCSYPALQMQAVPSSLFLEKYGQATHWKVAGLKMKLGAWHLQVVLSLLGFEASGHALQTWLNNPNPGLQIHWLPFHSSLGLVHLGTHFPSTLLNPNMH